jgi:hypothetical protein
VERCSTHNLNIEVAKTEGPYGSFSHGRKSLGKKFIQGFAASKSFSKDSSFALELLVTELLVVRLESVYFLCDCFQFAKDSAFAGA